MRLIHSDGRPSVELRGSDRPPDNNARLVSSAGVDFVQSFHLAYPDQALPVAAREMRSGRGRAGRGGSGRAGRALRAR